MDARGKSPSAHLLREPRMDSHWSHPRRAVPAPSDRHRVCALDVSDLTSWALRAHNHLFDRDAGFTASYMETLIMTERGIEVLSRLPRTLTVLPG